MDRLGRHVFATAAVISLVVLLLVCLLWISSRTTRVPRRIAPIWPGVSLWLERNDVAIMSSTETMEISPDNPRLRTVSILFHANARFHFPATTAALAILPAAWLIGALSRARRQNVKA